MESNHAPDDQHKASTPDPTKITGGELKKAAALGGARSLGGAIVGLILWGLRNIT